MALPPLPKSNIWNDVTLHQKIKQYKDGIAPNDKSIQNFVKSVSLFNTENASKHMHAERQHGALIGIFFFA
jgi:hypothetical protein